MPHGMGFLLGTKQSAEFAQWLLWVKEDVTIGGTATSGLYLQIQTGIIVIVPGV